MKKFISVIVFGVLLNITAFAAEVSCEYLSKKSVYAVKVAPNENVTVKGRQTASNGYGWISKQDVPFIIAPTEGIGSWGPIVFTIDTNLQTTKSKKYTFTFSRPWEKTVRPLSTCSVKVVKN